MTPSGISVQDATAPFVLHTRVVTGTGGGPEKTILNSPRYLRRFGMDAACLFMRPPQDPGFRSLETKATATDAEIIGVDDRGPMDPGVLRACLRICRERRVAIWHAHDYKSNAIGLLLRHFHPMHLVTTAHGWVRRTSRTPLYYRIDRFCLKRFDQVICVSPDLQAQCLAAGVSPDRLSLVDNAIIPEEYATGPAGPGVRERFGAEPQGLLIGAAGRLSEEKGFRHLITAVGRLVSEGHCVQLVIAGEGHLRPVLQQQIDALGLQDRVRLPGFLEDPRDFYEALDLFVLSSLREGLPNVVLEAMATGRPVVATNCNGVPRLVRDGENGLVVPVDDPAELTNAMRRCVTSPSLRERLAAAGRSTIETDFSFDQRMRKIIRVYRRLSPEIAAVIPEWEPCRKAVSGYLSDVAR